MELVRVKSSVVYSFHQITAYILLSTRIHNNMDHFLPVLSLIYLLLLLNDSHPKLHQNKSEELIN